MPLSPEEIYRRQCILDDYRRVMPHIPKDITDKLEAVLPEEANSPLFELMLVMVQLGRHLERSDQLGEAIVVMPPREGAQPSNLLNAMGQRLQQQINDPELKLVIADERALDALHKKD